MNDTIGDEPIAVTFCPLCNSAMAFKRQLDSQVLDFGTTWRLRHSDLVMWDCQTESWWQQLTGEAIIGTLAGKQLEAVPTSIVSYAAFKQTFPDGVVLSKDTGRAPSPGRAHGDERSKGLGLHKLAADPQFQGGDAIDDSPELV